VKASSSYGSLQSAELTVIPKKKDKKEEEKEEEEEKKKKKNARDGGVYGAVFATRRGCERRDDVSVRLFSISRSHEKENGNNNEDRSITHEFVDHQRLLGIVRLESG